MEIPDTFLCIGCISRLVQSFKGFGQNLLKELFKDKILGRIPALQHILHENRPISSAFKQEENRLYQKLQRSHL